MLHLHKSCLKVLLIIELSLHHSIGGLPVKMSIKAMENSCCKHYFVDLQDIIIEKW